VYPVTTKQQRHDQFGHEYWLHLGHGSKVKGERLEDQRSRKRHPSEEPEGLAKEVDNEAPARKALPTSRGGNVLRRYRDSIRERRDESEENRQALVECEIAVHALTLGHAVASHEKRPRQRPLVAPESARELLGEQIGVARPSSREVVAILDAERGTDIGIAATLGKLPRPSNEI